MPGTNTKQATTIARDIAMNNANKIRKRIEKYAEYLPILIVLFPALLCLSGCQLQQYYSAAKDGQLCVKITNETQQVYNAETGQLKPGMYDLQILPAKCSEIECTNQQDCIEAKGEGYGCFDYKCKEIKGEVK